MDIYFKRTMSGLTPMYDSDYEALKKIKIGDEIKASISKPRNYKFHKKFMALLNICFHNQCKYETFDSFRYVMTLKAGFFDEIATDRGVVFKAKSINFSSMDEYSFSELYSKMIDVLIKEIGCTSEEIELEILNFS